MRIVLLCALAVWLAFSLAPALAQPVTQTVQAGAVRLTVELDRSTLAIDDELRLSLEIEAPDDLVITFADLAGQLDRFAVVGEAVEEPSPVGADRKVWRQSYTLVPEDVGELTLPPIEIAWRRGAGSAEERLASEPIMVTVTSVLPPDADVYDPRDIAPPVLLPRPRWSAAVWLLAGALAIAGLLVWSIWRQRQRRVRTEIRLPAHVLALDELSRLERDDLIGEGRIEELHVRLADVIRHYAAARFGLAAPLRTTEELLAEIDAAHGPLAAHRELLAALLGQCDLVKFAAHRPSTEAMRQALRDARALVEQTADSSVLVHVTAASPGPAGPPPVAALARSPA